MQQPGRPSASTGAGSKPLTCAGDRQRSPCGEFTPRRSRPTPTPLRFGTTMGPHVLHVAGQSACHHTRCIAPRPTLTSQNAQPHVLGSRGRRFKSGRPDAGQWLVSGFQLLVLGRDGSARVPPSAAQTWDETIAELSADHRCVAPTLPLGADLSLLGIATRAGSAAAARLGTATASCQNGPRWPHNGARGASWAGPADAARRAQVTVSCRRPASTEGEHYSFLPRLGNGGWR